MNKRERERKRNGIRNLQTFSFFQNEPNDNIIWSITLYNTHKNIYNSTTSAAEKKTRRFLKLHCKLGWYCFNFKLVHLFVFFYFHRLLLFFWHSVIHMIIVSLVRAYFLVENNKKHAEKSPNRNDARLCTTSASYLVSNSISKCSFTRVNACMKLHILSTISYLLMLISQFDFFFIFSLGKKTF